MSKPPRLILVLGDQLSPDIAALKAADRDTDIVVMAEVADEASYVAHHPKKIAFIFAAMRHFAAQLRDAVSKRAPEVNVLVMAAAVADFRPAHLATSKIKKGPDAAGDPTIELVRNDDVLAGAVRARTDGQLPHMRAIVGFAAETGDENGDVLFHARAKLKRKDCDLLVVNAVGDNRAFEVDHNDGWLLSADGTESALEHGSKTLIASRIVDAIAAFLRTGRG